MVLDFRLSTYRKLMEAIADSGYVIRTVKGYISQKKSKGEHFNVILRHDVELYPNRAFRLAQLEYSLGICSTYYFRNPLYYTQQPIYPYRTPIKSTIQIIQSIANFGHEIGYHYETLDKTKGNFPAANEVFKNELIYFRRKTEIDVKTVCSHGGRSMIQNRKDGYERNLDIFKRFPNLYEEVTILGEAYLDIDFSKLTYFSDSGARWNRCKNTKELIRYLRNNEEDIYILAHPDWWHDSLIGALFQGLENKAVSLLIKIKK